MQSTVSAGVKNLKHLVVLMMSGRSFDHMLGSLASQNPGIDGLKGSESNPDHQGNQVSVQPLAEYQGQLTPRPNTRFSGVDLQIFDGDDSPSRIPNMRGFIKSYYRQRRNPPQSHKIMHYFTPDKLPVLTSLATDYAVFNRWFASIPGPGVCNRAFAHYGTSFGQVSMEKFDEGKQYKSIYDRMLLAHHTAKVYYYDKESSESVMPASLQNQPSLSGTFADFVQACNQNALPDYCFVEPNRTDHEALDGSGEAIACDQDPDHDVRAGEQFIATVYNMIRGNAALWSSTALLIVYDDHGGIYDHVPPPACVPDGFFAPPSRTGTPDAFHFDRLGVRVPAILVSPWVPKGTVINDVFEHASIPRTVAQFFIGDSESANASSPRELAANHFLDYLSLSTIREDSLVFQMDEAAPTEQSHRAKESSIAATEPPELITSIPTEASSGSSRLTEAPGRATVAASPPRATEHDGPSTHVARDRWTTDDSLGHYPYAYAIYRFLTDPETKPPLAISIQAPWGGGKTSLMRMIQAQLDPDAVKHFDGVRAANTNDAKPATIKQVLREMNKADPQNGNETAPSDMTGESIASKRIIPPIREPGQRRVTIWFNAWQYESTEQVWAGLADCIVQQIGERLSLVERELFWFRLQLRRLDAGKIRRRIQDEIFAVFAGKIWSWALAYFLVFIGILVAAFNHWWTGAGGAFIAEVVACGIQFKKAKVETERRPARVSLGDIVQAPDYAANLGFVHGVAEDLKRVFSLIPPKHLPMVIFIDDLDRCSPGKVAAVIEAINLFLAGEFPDCMFILGIDDEMVAAALDQAHSQVIAKLPSYARSTSIGWRFMDKFVQLPFVVPPATKEDLGTYVESLLSQGGARRDVGMQARDIAARAVEGGDASSKTPEQVVNRVMAQQPLAKDQQEALKEEIKIIQGMNENINRFTDLDKEIHEAISQYAKLYFSNPRDTKRFVNLFRFYYFLRAARQGRELQVPSIDQLCRWLVFSLKWPEVIRWVRHHPRSDDQSDFRFATLERLGGETKSVSKWQDGMNKTFGLDLGQAEWLADEELYSFLKAEFKMEDRLSSCSEGGLW